MTIPQELYPHYPPSLLPLLSTHLPHSLPLYGAIKTNVWPERDLPAGTSLPRDKDTLDEETIASYAWTTFPPGTDWAKLSSGNAASAGASEPSQSSELPMSSERLVSSESPLSSGSVRAEWAALVHLPKPQMGQTSHYCSIASRLLDFPVDRSIGHPNDNQSELKDVREAASAKSTVNEPSKPRSSGRSQLGTDSTVIDATPDGQAQCSSGTDGINDIESSTRHAERQSSVSRSTRWKLWRKGQDLMNTLVLVTRQCYPAVCKYGSMNTLWTEECIKVLGSSAKGTYNIWIAPRGQAEDGGPDKEGFEVGMASEEECVLVQQTREIPEIIEYYLSRRDKISVIRRTAEPDKGEAVAWIMTHAGGDLGALYTQPAWRRKGLGRWVSVERMNAARGGDAGGATNGSAAGTKGDETESGREGTESDQVDDGLRGYVYVGEDNVGSRRLWETMGWQRGWDVQWVHAQ